MQTQEEHNHLLLKIILVPFIVADKDEYSISEGDDVTINLTSGYMTTQVYWRFKSTTQITMEIFIVWIIYRFDKQWIFGNSNYLNISRRSRSFTMSAIKDYRTENSNSGGANQDVRED